MNDTLQQQLNQWHAQDEHRNIIDAIEAIAPDERDYDMIGLLARAYNNDEQYHAALAQLALIEAQGKDDPLWNFRKAYAYFYLKRYQQAQPLFERAAQLDPADPDAPMFLSQISLMTKETSKF